MKAASYCRYSTDQQRDASLADQLRNIRKRIDAEGWELVATYNDAAITGSIANRPEYKAMLAAAARGEFNVLLLDDLSRLTRDSVEQERVIRRLEFSGVRIIATSDGYDSESKARKIHRGMKGMMNEIFLDDLRERVHRGQEGQARKDYWLGGRPYGFKLKPILDPTERDAYGAAARIGTVLEVEPNQATVVRDIFQRFVDGASCQTIARELNARKVGSPGSTWRRKTRRANGWMGSAVRVILRNPLYTGKVRWNVSAFVLNPDTGKHLRRARPKADWVVHQEERLRIVADELYAKAQARTRGRRDSDPRLKVGGKPKFLLSGLLVCGTCKAHYVMGDNRAYVCSGHRDGACANSIRVRRDAVETAVLNPLCNDLLSPERVARMAKELQQEYAARMRSMQARAVEVPKELDALDARIARLRDRLKRGDPDMAADEIEAAIERAQSKRQELTGAQPSARDGARVFAMLPNTAELYRRQIGLGLDGHPAEALKARTFLRSLLGDIRLEPGEGGSLWAAYEMQPGALIRAAVTGGRGDRI